MNSRHLLVAALATTVVASGVREAAAAPARQQSRADHILFTAPDRWKHADNDGYTALRPPDVPAGKSVELRIHPARPLAGTLDAAAAAQLETFGRAYPGAQAYKMNPVRHETGFDMIITGVARPVVGGAVYDSLCFVRAGDQVQMVEMETSDFELYQKHLRTWDALLHSMRLTDAVVLAKGDPPLTQATVDAITDFLEWLIEVPFTEEQKAMIAGNVADSWKRNDRAEIEGTMQALKLRDQLAQMTPQQKAVARQAAQPELIKAARQEADPVAKMIVQVYEAGRRPIADGDPPLTRQASDAMLEVLLFMAAQVQGGDAAAAALPPPTPEMKDQWAKNLAANYDKADDAARGEIAKMPLTWAALRMIWADLPEADKTQARAQWAKSDEVKQVAEVVDRMRPRQPAQNPAGGATGFVAEGRNVVYDDGRVRYVVFNLDSEQAARARAAEMNRGRDPGSQANDAASAADLMAERTRDYQFTKSMLNTGYNNTIMQMAAMSGNRWRYK